MGEIANELHVPVGRMVKMTLASQDVIHSFFLPAFRVKRDVIPGYYTSEWFEPTRIGTYHLFCAEYCGTQHSGMIGKIIVMAPADYQRWLEAGNPGSTLAQAGERRFRPHHRVRIAVKSKDRPGGLSYIAPPGLSSLSVN